MEQEYIKIAGILETGIELISPHLRWLLRHAIVEHCGVEAVSQIAYCKDIPLDSKGKPIWAETFSPTRSIALNLEQNFNCCTSKVKTESEMHTALRTLVIRELLDSAIHEAHHLKVSLETGDFSNSALEEQEAVKAGYEKSWQAAQHWDADIKVFGPVIDPMIEKFIDDLRKKKDALVDEEAEMWIDLQIFMWDNNLAFYDPENENERNIHGAFEAMANTGIPWSEEPKRFVGEIQKEQDDLAQTDTTLPDVMSPQIPVVSEVQTEPEMEHVQNVPETAIPIKSNEQLVVPPPPVESIIPPPPVEPVAPVAPTVDDNVLQIQRIVERVMRTLFVHVMTKCGFNTEGGYNNPTAVLEPISLHTIPGAAELITHMDIQDGIGIPKTLQPCNGFLSGIVDKSGKYPMYKFYMTIGGKQYRRSFMVQNPTTQVDGQLKPWAKAASEGTRIMALYPETGGPTAHLKLGPNMPFGQEEFTIWSQK